MKEKEKATATIEHNGKKFICLPGYIYGLESNSIQADEDSVAASACIGGLEVYKVESTGKYYVNVEELKLRAKNSKRRLPKAELGWVTVKQAVYELFKNGIYVTSDDLYAPMTFGGIVWKTDQYGRTLITVGELEKRMISWAPNVKTGLERSGGTVRTI